MGTQLCLVLCVHLLMNDDLHTGIDELLKKKLILNGRQKCDTVGIGYCDYHLMTLVSVLIGYCDYFPNSQKPISVL